jgi:fused signal recognition particle receptor
MFGLRKSLSSIFKRSRVDEELFESLEESLLLADVGIHATSELMAKLRTLAKKEKIDNGEVLKSTLESLITKLLQPLEFTNNPLISHNPTNHPEIWLVVGVNGAGKTTSIGKICHALQKQNKKVLLAAGDTFRAAAREQLSEWGMRNHVEVINQTARRCIHSST